MFRLAVVAACLVGCSGSNCPDVTPTIRFSTLTADQLNAIVVGSTGTCDGGCEENDTQNGQNCNFTGVLMLAEGVATTSGNSATKNQNGSQCTKHVVFTGVDTLTTDVQSSGGESGNGTYVISDAGSGTFIGSCP